MTREERKRERDEIRARREEAKREEKKRVQEEKKKEKEALRAEAKRKNSWFQKIPTHVLLSPAGMIIIFVVLIVEVIGVLIPIPIISTLFQFPFQVILIILLITIAKVSIKSLILPYVIDFFFPFLPVWIIRILM